MKKTILTIALSTLTVGALLTSCNSTGENLEDAQENASAANEKLDKANEEYEKDMENYRLEASEKIAANEKSIKDFNDRMAKEKKEVTADYKKKMDELNQQNSDMKKKMDDYQAEGKEQWDTFKTEFSNDMDKLGKAFKELFTTNKLS